MWGLAQPWLMLLMKRVPLIASGATTLIPPTAARHMATTVHSGSMADSLSAPARGITGASMATRVTTCAAALAMAAATAIAVDMRLAADMQVALADMRAEQPEVMRAEQPEVMRAEHPVDIAAALHEVDSAVAVPVVAVVVAVPAVAVVVVVDAVVVVVVVDTGKF